MAGSIFHSPWCSCCIKMVTCMMQHTKKAAGRVSNPSASSSLPTASLKPPIQEKKAENRENTPP